MLRVINLSAADLVAERVVPGAEDVHFPQALVRAVLEEYSSGGDTVLDPFAGYGTTLVVSEEMGRSAVGVELLPDRVEIIERRLRGRGRIIVADARQLDNVPLGPVDLCVTSPPYMSKFDHPENPLTGYATLDGAYPVYLAELTEVFRSVARVLRPGGHLVINAANIRTGRLWTPLAWDIARAVASFLQFRGEIYLQWDVLPETFSGDYCLVFAKD